MFLCLCVPAVLFCQKSCLICICVMQILWFWHVLLLSDEDVWRKTIRSRICLVTDHRIIWVERYLLKMIKSNALVLSRGIFICIRLLWALEGFVPWSSQRWCWQVSSSQDLPFYPFLRCVQCFPFSPGTSSGCRDFSNIIGSGLPTTTAKSLGILGCILSGPIDVGVFQLLPQVVSDLIFSYSERDLAPSVPALPHSRGVARVMRQKMEHLVCCSQFASRVHQK